MFRKFGFLIVIVSIILNSVRLSFSQYSKVCQSNERSSGLRLKRSESSSYESSFEEMIRWVKEVKTISKPVSVMSCAQAIIVYGTCDLNDIDTIHLFKTLAQHCKLGKIMCPEPNPVFQNFLEIVAPMILQDFDLPKRLSDNALKQLWSNKICPSKCKALETSKLRLPVWASRDLPFCSVIPEEISCDSAALIEIPQKSQTPTIPSKIVPVTEVSASTPKPEPESRAFEKETKGTQPEPSFDFDIGDPIQENVPALEKETGESPSSFPSLSWWWLLILLVPIVIFGIYCIFRQRLRDWKETWFSRPRQEHPRRASTRQQWQTFEVNNNRPDDNDIGANQTPPGYVNLGPKADTQRNRYLREQLDLQQESPQRTLPFPALHDSIYRSQIRSTVYSSQTIPVYNYQEFSDPVQSQSQQSSRPPLPPPAPPQDRNVVHEESSSLSNALARALEERRSFRQNRTNAQNAGTPSSSYPNEGFSTTTLSSPYYQPSDAKMLAEMNKCNEEIYCEIDSSFEDEYDYAEANFSQFIESNVVCSAF